VLAWFEARGYRAAPVSPQRRPIELVLRHRTDVGRIYAFVVERELVTAARAASLLALARAAGVSRVLIAAEAGSEARLPAKVQRQGVRIFDDEAIRAELGKVDISVQAKIIAVARSRAMTRPPVPAALASRPPTAALNAARL